MITTKTVLLAVSLLLVALKVYAHGDEEHGKKGGGTDHAAALGTPGDVKKATRTVEVGMDDNMRFSPAHINVKKGQTIRFVVKNNGKLKHEMVLGTAKELKEHAALMRKFPEMEHADPNQVSVAPGQSGELVWRFTRTGTFEFACLQPGHSEAGMVGKISVAAPTGAVK